MTSHVDTTWLEARIAKTKTLIEAYEDAITTLSTGGVQMYSLDTGQTRQMVSRAQLSQLKNTLAMLENRLATLEARLNGAATRVIPGF